MAQQSSSSDSSPSLASHLQSLENRGQPLPPSLRQFFEPRFRQDFSQVRIHTGHQATQLAESMNARAFTMGRHIVFRSADYHPDSASGKRLFAHELTHIVQQSGQLNRMVQRQDLPPGPKLDFAEPDFGCTIDLITAARVIAGDRKAALKVINCCVKGLPLVKKGCTKHLVDAACFLFPDLCRDRKRDEAVQCPLGFKPAASSHLTREMLSRESRR